MPVLFDVGEDRYSHLISVFYFALLTKNLMGVPYALGVSVCFVLITAMRMGAVVVWYFVPCAILEFYATSQKDV